MVKFRDSFLSVCIGIFAVSVVIHSSPLQHEVKDKGYLGLFTKTLPRSIRRFTISIFQKLSKELRSEENILVSPVSAYGALLLLHLGAGESTRYGLDEALKLPENNTDFPKLPGTFGDILKKIQRKSANAEEMLPEAIITNGFFVQKERPILDSYYEMLKRYYRANVTNLDFAEHAQEATDKINSEKFNTGTAEIEVPMMRGRNVILYTGSDSLLFDSIELEYKGGEFVMLIHLPRPTQTIKNLTEHMHLLDMEEINQNSREVGVDYKIPKMKFSWKNSLVDALQLEDVFRFADLNEMTTENVTISDMVQATEIEVDEQGTIATAATAIGVSRVLPPLPPAEELVKFYVERPFIASILHKPTQMILFFGAIQKPIQ